MRLLADAVAGVLLSALFWLVAMSADSLYWLSKLADTAEDWLRFRILVIACRNGWWPTGPDGKPRE